MRVWIVALLGTLTLGCAEQFDDPTVADARDASFFVDGKADRVWLTRDDIRRVLYTVNANDTDALDDEVGIDARAADAIIGYRAGDDGVLLTADDRWIGGLRELDDRPWVGPLAFEQLVEHTRSVGASEVTELLADQSWCDAATDGTVRNGECADVTHVIDGDTIELTLADGSTVRMRLRGIDTPECHKRRIDGHSQCVDSALGERFGYEAYVALRGMAEGERVRIACEMVGGQCRTDLYGRLLAWPVLQRSYTDLAEAMVAGGYAWPYLPMHAISLHEYCAAEDEAILAGRGLWSEGYDAAILGMSSDKQRWYGRRSFVCP